MCRSWDQTGEPKHIEGEAETKSRCLEECLQEHFGATSQRVQRVGEFSRYEERPDGEGGGGRGANKGHQVDF